MGRDGERLTDGGEGELDGCLRAEERFEGFFKEEECRWCLLLSCPCRYGGKKKSYILTALAHCYCNGWRREN